ncbi:TB182 protein, partial [Rhinopomastus cyanomelas]|nr:TB182 protein [Rhinopomastus cyanomelas]
PGSPFQPTEPSAPAPGSPNAPQELLSPGSPTLDPSSRKSLAQLLVEVSIPAPGAPSSAAEPRLGTARSPGSPHTPGEGPPNTTSPPGTPKLPPRVTCPPGSPEAATDHPVTPTIPPNKSSRPPGSPEGPDDSPVSLQPPKGLSFSPSLLSRDSGLRRSSEGVLQPPAVGQGLGELGGSMSALPRPGDPLPEPSLGSESGWSLSQSFEWTFPSRGARRPVSPLQSPIVETDDLGLSEEGEDAAPSIPHSQEEDSGSDDSQGAEGSPCPGGPMAKRETKGLVEEEEEQDAAVSSSPLYVTEPIQGPDEPESPAQSASIETTSLDLATVAGSASAWLPSSDCSASPQGPGGPSGAGGSLSHCDPHSDPGWLTELLASPGPRAVAQGSLESSEDLLGWSRKDLCREFGITRAPREGCSQGQDLGAGKPEWSRGYGLGSREEIGAGKAGWSSSRSVVHGQEQDKELSSEQPSWASSSDPGDPEGQHGDITPAWATGTETKPTPDWASKYSSRGVKSKDKDLTLGWAGRTSTEDTGSPEKEFSPRRAAWDDRYSSRAMESQDWEFSPSRPAWTSEQSSRAMESQDREFSPSRPAWTSEQSSRAMESQDQEFSPSRPTWDDQYSIRDLGTQDRTMESQDREFSPSRSAWAGECSTQNVESQDSGFKPSRPAWEEMGSTMETGNRDMETWVRSVGTQDRDPESWDQEFRPSRPAEAAQDSTRDVVTWDREFKSSQPTWDDSGCSSTSTARGQQSWAAEGGAGRTKLDDAVGAGMEDSPGSSAPDFPERGPGCDSTNQQDHSATARRDWPEELGGAVCHNQFGIAGTEQVPDHLSTGVSPGASLSWTDGLRSECLGESLGAWQGDLSFGSSGVASDSGLGEPGWSTELHEAEAKRREWASAFGARCAARSQDFGAREQSLGDDTSSAVGITDTQVPCSALPVSLFPLGLLVKGPQGRVVVSVSWSNSGVSSCLPSRSILLPDHSPPTDDAPAVFPAAEPYQSDLSQPTEEEQNPPELPRLTEEEQDPHEVARPSKEEQDTPEPLLINSTSPGAPGGTLLVVESKGAPSDCLDGKRPPSWEEKRLSLGSPQPEATVGQEFAFLKDTEVLDSSIYRTKASLGRKRRHRAPALRLSATTEGDAWIFQDSTEPRPAHPAASSDEDEEAVEEPKSRRVRAFPSGRGVKVPLFPGLSASALKAKLRGRNRSAEEGSVPADSKGTPAKDPHLVQRSKSCKIPSGKPPALPPKPDKCSGSEASPPHWLQVLKLKKKK